jgi:uncharacterized membrane protein
MTIVRSVLRWLAVVAFVLVGIAHFVFEDFFLSIMPPWIPFHRACVLLSGVAEIAGGQGLLLERTRRAAAWGLLALLVAVFPANLWMAFTGACPQGLECTPLGLWMRLPFQLVFAVWIGFVGLSPGARAPGQQA